MMRTLLTATALSTMIVTGAFGQANQAQQPGSPNAGITLQQGYVAQPTDSFADHMIGIGVFDSEQPDARRIGEIDDIVLNANGGAVAVIIGLDQDNKSVAIGYNDVKWVQAQNGEERYVLTNTDAQALASAPAFAYPQFNEDVAQAEEERLTSAPQAARTTETLDRDAMSRIDIGTISVSDLIGASVIGPNEEDVGAVSDVVLSDEGGQADAVIVDVGGFLGIGAKPVALGLDNVDVRRNEGGSTYMFVGFTEEQLRQQPEYDASSYEANRGIQRMTPQAR